MKKIIYLYVLDSMAEWEIGNILQAISMEAALKENKREFIIKTVGVSKSPVQTIGGLTIIPDCSLSEIDEDRLVALLLPGADTWNNEVNNEVLQKSIELIEKDVLVGAICGATLALAELKVLDKFKHTSNSIEYLKIFSKQYRGEKLYINTTATRDRNLITASSAGSLLWAKLILEYLNVYPNEKIESWYNYFKIGDPKYFVELFS